MVGYMQAAIAEALSDWETLKDANVVPVRPEGGDSCVVNTTLPAIAVHVVGTEGEGNVFIGGGIRQYFDMELHVIIEVPNYTFSKDDGIQAKRLDVSDDVIRCVEHPDFLTDIKGVHDLNMEYDRMETGPTYGSKGSVSVTVDVHKVIYRCSVQFNPQDSAYNAYVELQRIEIDNNGINESIIE